MKPILIERGRNDRGWFLKASYPDGDDIYFGTEMTERGSKRMLTVRAKQFGLSVSGNIAN